MVRSQIIELRIHRHPKDRRRQSQNNQNAPSNHQRTNSNESSPYQQQHFWQPTRKPQSDHWVRTSQVRRLANLLPLTKKTNPGSPYVGAGFFSVFSRKKRGDPEWRKAGKTPIPSLKVHMLKLHCSKLWSYWYHWYNLKLWTYGCIGIIDIISNCERMAVLVSLI